jgi:Transglycosylase SLT domain
MAASVALVGRALLGCLSIVGICSYAVAGSPNFVVDHPCDLAISVAEQQFGVPPRLLAAIGVTESGRREPADGSMHPWPWAANADGRPFFYSTQAEAVAGVRAMHGQGVRSIDIGCMQINLLHHPDAFTSLEAGFDPQINALYAARFLRELFVRTGDWSQAAGLYHSATEEYGAPYRRMVMANWLGQQGGSNGASLSNTARAWAATLATRSPGLWQGMAMPAEHGSLAGVPGWSR